MTSPINLPLRVQDEGPYLLDRDGQYAILVCAADWTPGTPEYERGRRIMEWAARVLNGESVHA